MENSTRLYGVEPKLKDQISSNIVEATSVEIPNISAFYAERLGTRPFEQLTTNTIIEWIKSDPATLTEYILAKEPDQYYKKFEGKIALTWGAKFKLHRHMDHITKFNGFICYGFRELAPERIQSLRSELLNDPLSCIVFTYPYDSGIKVVVQIDCNNVRDYELYFLRLSNYYKQTYGIIDTEIDERSKKVTHICFLPHDPSVYFNPQSLRVSLEDFSVLTTVDKTGSKTNVNNNKLTVNQALSNDVSLDDHLEIVDDSNLTEIETYEDKLDVNESLPDSEGTNNLGVQPEIVASAESIVTDSSINKSDRITISVDDERDDTSLTDEDFKQWIRKWYTSKIVSKNSGFLDSETDILPTVQITISPIDNNSNQLDLNFEVTRANEKTTLLNIQSSGKTGEIVLGSEEVAKSNSGKKAKRVSPEKIGNHLVEILSNGKKPKMEVYELLMSIYNQSYKTVYNKIKPILTDQTLISDSYHKLFFQLQEKEDGTFRYLYLKLVT